MCVRRLGGESGVRVGVRGACPVLWPLQQDWSNSEAAEGHLEESPASANGVTRMIVVPHPPHLSLRPQCLKLTFWAQLSMNL